MTLVVSILLLTTTTVCIWLVAGDATKIRTRDARTVLILPAKPGKEARRG